MKSISSMEGSSMIVSKAKTKTTFWSLPRELRDMVYRHLLDPPSSSIDIASIPKFKYPEPLQREVLTAYYTSNEFHFKRNVHWYNFHERLSRNSLQANLFKHIRCIHVIMLCVESSFCPVHKAAAFAGWHEQVEVRVRLKDGTIEVEKVCLTFSHSTTDLGPPERISNTVKSAIKPEKDGRVTGLSVVEFGIKMAANIDGRLRFFLHVTTGEVRAMRRVPVSHQIYGLVQAAPSAVCHAHVSVVSEKYTD